MKETTTIELPAKVDYPKIGFWNHIPEEKHLRIINPSDFPQREILSSLGISESSLASTFGICDPKEIKERQELMRFFVEHPELARWVV